MNRDSKTDTMTEVASPFPSLEASIHKEGKKRKEKQKDKKGEEKKTLIALSSGFLLIRGASTISLLILHLLLLLFLLLLLLLLLLLPLLLPCIE